ncbi:hypothetical protein, partial [Acinetobacter baumannii]|uniref:hypothetical protein n=1 Tax=Acinetobacter baumannii TaxID=470 RepID=UPI001C0979EF
MTQISTQAATERHRRRPAGRLSRVVSCIRFDEVAALQGTPLIGAIFSIGALSVDHAIGLALL